MIKSFLSPDSYKESGLFVLELFKLAPKVSAFCRNNNWKRVCPWFRTQDNVAI